MPGTRKVSGGRRRAHQRRKSMKGGGRLFRLPIGPGSRNAAGNPAEALPPSEIRRRAEGGAAAVPAVGGAGAGAPAPPAFPLIGTMNAFKQNKPGVEKRMPALSAIYEKPESVNWTDPVYLKHVQSMIPLLKRNLQRSYITPNVYESVSSRRNNIENQFGISMSSLSEEEAKAYALPPIPSLLEVKAELEADLNSNWDFKYICGHGVLAPDLPDAIVPPRTYIRFHSPAGCVAVLSGKETGFVPIMAFPDIFAQRREPFIRDMVNSYLNNSGPLESFSSAAEVTTLLRNPYPGDFCSDPNNPLLESKKCLAPEYTKQTIYMPGDSMTEMNISFSNNPYQIFILGVYDLPMDPAGFYYAIQTVAENSAEIGESQPHMSAAQLAQAQAFQYAEDIKYFQNDNFIIRNEMGVPLTIQNPNLAKDVIGSTLKLSEVLHILNERSPVPDGKVRFLFINSCRGVPRVPEDDTGLTARVLGGWGAGARVRGAGSTARRNMAVRARRKSLLGRVDEDDALFHQLIEARRYMRTHPMTDPLSVEKAAFDRRMRDEKFHIWSIAVSLVP